MDELLKKLVKQVLSEQNDTVKDETLKDFCCPNEECAKYGISGESNIRVHFTYGQNHTRLLYCTKCKQTFSEYRGAFPFNTRIPLEKVAAILQHLADGKSQRKIADLEGVNRSTVSDYAKRAKGNFQKHHDEVVAYLSQKQKNAVRYEIGVHPEKPVGDMAEYQDCLYHPIFETLYMHDSISGATLDKCIGYTRYCISSKDGNTYPITLFTCKLWDILLLKLTELVYSNRQFCWNNCEKWHIPLSIQAISDSLGLSDQRDSLSNLYHHIVAVAEALQNINILVPNGVNVRSGIREDAQIAGYLSGVEISGVEDNASFIFAINPELIEHIKSKKPRLYRFDLRWLRLPVHHQKRQSRFIYSVAKRLSQQNTSGRQFVRLDMKDLITTG